MSKKEAGNKKDKKKRTEVGSYYQIEENGLKRLRPSCERCGLGYFMADHGDRFTCGHCGLTRYKQQS
jgi:small subunit ribosomal protein S27Ae